MDFLRTLAGNGTKTSFEPDEHIPDLEGKVFVVTGANTGLGKETVLRLAKHNPHKIFVCCRNREKGEQAVREIKTIVPDASLVLVNLDLASLASVAAAAKDILSQTDRLDVLINNAGIMAVPTTLSPDNHEIQWSTNYLGPFLLTRTLLPLLQSTANKPNTDVRIINLTSQGHKLAPRDCGINLSDPSLPSAGPWIRYGQSKLANVLHAKQLAKLYPTILSVSVHPGAIATNLADGYLDTLPSFVQFLAPKIVPYFVSGVEDGAKNTLWCAVGAARGEVVTGGYYLPVGKLDEAVAMEGGWSTDDGLAGRLWEWSEKEMGRLGY